MVDWASIEKEFLQGMARPAIIAKYQCTPAALNSRIHTGKWAVKKNKMIEDASKKAQVAAQRHLVTNGAAAFVERVQKQVNIGLDVLEQNAPETINEAEKHSRVLDNYDKIGRRVYGLDGENGGGKTVFQFNMVAEEPRPIEAKVVSSCQVIEDSPREATGLKPAAPDATPA